MKSPSEVGNSWFTTDLLPEVKTRIERKSGYLKALNVSKDELVKAVQDRFASDPCQKPPRASPKASKRSR